MADHEPEVGISTTEILKMTKAPISDLLKARLRDKHKRFFANDNIADVFESEDEKRLLIEEVAGKFTSVLESLVIDVENDPNSHDTGRRFAKMYVNEFFAGRYNLAPKATSFPNEKLNPLGNNGDETRPAYSYGGLLVVPTELISMCSHHHQIVRANCYIGIVPGQEVIGLSKYGRIAQHQAQRGTLQEQLTQDILRAIQKATKTQDVAVFIVGTHGCMTNRGVHLHDAHTTTAELGGIFIANPSLKDEFYRHIELLEKRRNA